MHVITREIVAQLLEDDFKKLLKKAGGSSYSPLDVYKAGDSLWEPENTDKNLAAAIIRYEIRVHSEKRDTRATWPGKAEEFPRYTYFSLDVYGPKPLPFWYTDSAVPKRVASIFKPELCRDLNCDDVMLVWSEQGLQGDEYWNFDGFAFYRAA